MKKIEVRLPEFLRPLATVTRPFPREAAAEAIARREESTPFLLAALERTVSDPEAAVAEEDGMLHYFALYLLAQFRERRAYGAAVKIARHRLVEDLLGDTVTEGLGAILASVSRGDPGSIQSLVEDENAYEYARGAGIEALGGLCRNGLWPRAALSDYLSELYAGRLKRENSHVWNISVAVSSDFGMEEHLEAIRALFEEGLTDPNFDDFASVQRRIRSGIDADIDPRPYRLIDDAVSEMKSWYCFGQSASAIERREKDGEEESGSELGRSEFSSHGSFESGRPRLDWRTFRRTEPKVGRNDPCPCGSGEKYKKCCGKP